MAGVVRQPIDVASLSRYIEAHVPEIELPIILKQVRSDIFASNLNVAYMERFSSAMDNPIPLISLPLPTAKGSFYGKSLRGIFYRRRLIRLSESIG